MIKVMYCMRRKPDMSREQFLAHWSQVHAPVVMENRTLLRLAHYARNWPCAHPLASRVERRSILQAPYDGVAELWWATQADMDFAFTDAQALEVQRWLAQDEAHFVDPSRSCRWISGEAQHF